MRGHRLAGRFVMLSLGATCACSRMDLLAVTTDAAPDRTFVGQETGRDLAPDSGSGAVPSAGCGRTSTITFTDVPNQDPNAVPGSGRTVGHGPGGYVKIQSSEKTRAFTMRLPDNYDPNHPYWLCRTRTRTPRLDRGTPWGTAKAATSPSRAEAEAGTSP